jgi:hypothetical protein
LDILKEAYIKIGQQDDALRVGRRLAESYLQNGLYSSALLECEQILSKQPTSPDVVALLGEIESRSGGSSSAPGTATPAANGKESNGKDASERGAESGLTAPRKGGPEESGLTAPREKGGESGLTAPGRGASDSTGLTAKVSPNSTSLTKTRRVPSGSPSHPSIALPEEDGSEQYARYLVHHRIVSDKVAVAALSQMRAINKKIIPGSQPAAALLEQVTKAGGPTVEDVLSGLIDATKLGYISLENYDIDRSVVRMLPETITMGRLVVPFDIVSRTLMVAFCNPFDSAAKEATHSSLDYHIQWYLAKPAAIMRVLKDVYRLDARD